MASSFPGGLDNFTNPTASDTLDSATVPHATQHANVNDAVEAIESTLGVNPQNSSASVAARLTAIDSTVAGKASTTHSSTHAAAGSDAVSLDASQITAGTLPVLRGGTGVATSTGTINNVLSNSPTLTGVPTAPTAAVDTSNFQIASTAYVVGQASATAPVMDGTATVGTSLRYSRQDHIHPSDTSRAPLASPTFTGTVTVPTPVNGTDAATKAYADSVAAGLNIHGSVSAASTANIAGTYANGTSGADGGLGVGATFTITATGVFILDTNTITLNERVLLKNQTTQTQNGIYYCTTAGAVGVQAVFTRATDSDNHIAGQVVPGDFVFVATGSQASTAWVQSTVGTSTNPVDGIKIGTDNITFTQFSAGSSYTNGSGIGSLSGGVIAVDSTVARTNSTNTFTGSQTVNGNVSLNGGNLYVQGPSAPVYLRYDATTGDVDLTSGSLNTVGNVGGGTGFFTNVTANNQFRLVTSLGASEARFQGTFTAIRTITVPDASITIAGAGANSDITSITGLTTPLTTAQGGTGSATATGTGSNVLATNPVITKPTITRAVYQNVAPVTLTWTTNAATVASGVLSAGWMRITSANLTATGTLTLPSTSICAAFLTTNGEASDVIVVNEASFAATATGVSGVTLLGNTSIAANSSATFRFYRTSSTVFVWVRIA